MSRKSPEIALIEMSGSQYSTLRAAQKSAVKSLAPSLAGTLRELIARGWLVTVDGQIVPSPEMRA